MNSPVIGTDWNRPVAEGRKKCVLTSSPDGWCDWGEDIRRPIGYRESSAVPAAPPTVTLIKDKGEIWENSVNYDQDTLKIAPSCFDKWKGKKTEIKSHITHELDTNTGDRDKKDV